MDDLNIRSTEERYGGEGHAGTDPFAGQQPRTGHPIPADPALEVPDASVADLTSLPNSDKADLVDPLDDGQTGQESSVPGGDGSSDADKSRSQAGSSTPDRAADSPRKDKA